ncbi:hypothetical protein KEM55_007128 [Ascosphaera atra]|nr:hypothetical protein KEM55_007128 [Ascosphaera atra]
MVRRQLDPVWHRVSWRTRHIAADLTVLRSILHSLLTYDCVSMIKYLDLILQAHAVPAGSTKQTQSPWLFLDAAHILFQTAKSRVYRGKITRGKTEDAIPDTLEPVLEEQPKWAVLADVLKEIERDAYMNPSSKGSSHGTVLIMCSDQKTCRQLRDYLETMHLRVRSRDRSGPENVETTDLTEDEEQKDEEEASAEFMLRHNLREYLMWKRQYVRASENLKKSAEQKPEAGNVPGYQSVGAATAKDRQPTGRAPPNKRRRVRGGSAAAAAPSRAANGSVQPEGETPQETNLLKSIEEEGEPEAEGEEGEDQKTIDLTNIVDDLEDMEDYYQLYDMDDLLLIYPYNGDVDEHVLEEAKPQYIIMYEPDPAFIRRVEVYRSSHTGRNVRVYFMYYGGSVEEQRYLSSVRREKDSFTKLIKEKGVSKQAAPACEVPQANASSSQWPSLSPTTNHQTTPKKSSSAQSTHASQAEVVWQRPPPLPPSSSTCASSAAHYHPSSTGNQWWSCPAN